MGVFDNLRARLGGRDNDPDADTLWTTPWAWRDDDGCYVGWNGQVWLYRSFPLAPIAQRWEDPKTLIRLGQQLDQLLNELGETSREGIPGLAATTADYREVHIVAITWEAMARPPEGTPTRLAQYMEESLGFLVPAKALMVGVKLRGASSSSTGLADSVKEALKSGLAEQTPDIDRYATDRAAVSAILGRAGCRPPTGEQLRQLESWYNMGKGPDAFIIERRDHLEVDRVDAIELAAVLDFQRSVNHAPNYQWVHEAETHPEGVRVVSVRAELEPATAARKRTRQSQRRIRSQIEEEMATGDLERAEYSDTFALASAVEDHFLNSQEPLLTRASIIMARRATDATETYADFLHNYMGIDVRNLDMRQLPALDETLPCSSKRVNPFVQELSVGMVAHAGLHGFAALGDKKGVYVGLADPNYTLTMVDPLGAPAVNKPPSMGIFGDPGSGKTFLAQMIAYQSSLMGLPVVFINPKGFDTLAPLAELAGGQVVSMSKAETEGGAFDPFRYAPSPVMAAEILATHILSVMTGFTEQEELALSYGLQQAAQRGARCAAEALRGVQNRDIVERVVQQVRSSPTFQLGFGLKPQERFDVGRRLTLIEFDRKLDLPDPSKDAASHTRNERIALAAIRLVTRASLEILAQARGGVMVVDEAWTFLSHPSGLAALQQLGREGRSLNLLPIFCTQRVADLLGSDMEGYLSRVFAMSLRDEREAAAALKLCGLEPTPARLQWLAQAGPQSGEDGNPARPAMALHRDLQDRHAAVLVGPVPEHVRQALTTNPVERERIRKRLEAERTSL